MPLRSVLQLAEIPGRRVNARAIIVNGGMNRGPPPDNAGEST
jgi:hypothetical protein